MTKKKTLLTLLITSFILLIILIALFSPFITVLSVSSRKMQPLRFYSIDGYKKGFVISYTHSVNKGRVHDYYKHTDDDKLELYKTSFVSYGAGIPEPEEMPGAVFTVKDKNYEISGINRVVPRLVMAVGLIAEHSITFDEAVEVGQKEFFLTDFFEPQTSIIFEYKKVSLVNYLSNRI
jgi:hypothetical protein